MTKQFKEFIDDLFVAGNKREIEICAMSFETINDKKGQKYCMVMLNLLKSNNNDKK